MTFQELYEEIESLTGDDSSSATTKHKLRINDTYKILLAKFNKRTESTDTTVASQQSYELPYNLKKLSSVKVTVSSIDYPLEQVYNEDRWNLMNDQGTSYTSDIQTHYYIKDNNILLYPTPASDGNTITYYYALKDKDMSNDDSDTGSTVKTLTNGDETVTLNAAGFTAVMVDRFFKINADGYWYRIASYTSTTVVELEKAFAGTSIAAGTSACTVAEMPLLPEEYHSALIYRPCWIYFMGKRDETGLAAFYKGMYDEIYNKITPEEDISTAKIIGGEEKEIKNVNDYPRV